MNDNLTRLLHGASCGGMNKQEPAPFVRLVYHEGMCEAHVCMWSEPHMIGFTV